MCTRDAASVWCLKRPQHHDKNHGVKMEKKLRKTTMTIEQRTYVIASWIVEQFSQPIKLYQWIYIEFRGQISPRKLKNKIWHQSTWLWLSETKQSLTVPLSYSCKLNSFDKCQHTIKSIHISQLLTWTKFINQHSTNHIFTYSSSQWQKWVQEIWLKV